MSQRASWGLEARPEKAGDLPEPQLFSQHFGCALRPRHKPSFSNTSLKSHAEAVIFTHQFFFFWLHLHETIVPIVLDFTLSKKMELKIPLKPLKQ